MSNQKKIKVMFIATSITGGGAEQVFFNILNSLPIEKYDIFLAITSVVDKTAIQLPQAIKIVIHNKRNARNSICKIYKDLLKFKPKYVFTSDLTIAYVFPILKLLLKNKFKIIIRIAVPPSEYPQNDIKTKVVQWFSKITYQKADLIIAQTQFMKKDVQSFYSIQESKIIVIRNLLNKSLLAQKGNESPDIIFNTSDYNVVASGALYSTKGFDLLIDAIKNIKNSIPNIKLYILGEERYEIGYKNFLQKMILENNLEEIVFLLGHKINPYPYYKAANLFVLSSRKEGYPNVVLEALFYGTPAVVTDCVDFSDLIINGENGFVVRKSSSESISAGIKKASVFLKKKVSAQLPNFNYEEIFQ